MADWKWDEERQAWRKELWFQGQRTKLTFRGTKKEAIEYEAKRRLELGAGAALRQASAPGFEDFSARTYQPHAKATLRASTWSVRKYQLQPLTLFFKQTKLNKLTTERVEAYKQSRVKEVEKVTVNDELKVLSAVLAYARHLDLACASPKIKKYAIAKKKGLVKVFTRDEVGFILAGARQVGESFYALVKFIADTGARRSEPLNLPWARTDLKRALAKIWNETDEDDAQYEVKSREREVTLSDSLVVVMKQQKLRAGQSPWCFPVETNRASRGGRMNTKGEKYAAWPKHKWKRALEIATELAQATNPRAKEISGGPHRLRHTYASTFLAAKPDLWALAQVLGHSHSRVTELYAHLLPEHLAATRNVVSFDAAPTRSA